MAGELGIDPRTSNGSRDEMQASLVSFCTATERRVHHLA